MVMKKHLGFTLIELMIVITIFAIILSMAVPSLKSITQSAGVKLATNELVSALYVSRSAAIKNSAFGCVCPSTNVNDLVPACSGTGLWETGWIAFGDSTGNCVFEAATDVLLKVWDGSVINDSQFTVRNDHVSITAVNLVRFNSRGEPVRADGISQQGNFKICNETGMTTYGDGKSDARVVQLSPSGRARFSDVSAVIVSCSL